jgi:hypothetical protein
MMNSSKRRVLMGEAAFTLDKVASEFVDLELEPSQMERWEQFRAFLKRQDWMLGKLCAQSRALKDLTMRGGDVHCTVEEKAGVSLADLVEWTGEELLVTAPTECRKFVELVSKFSEAGNPLQPMADVSAVVNAP